MRIIRILLMVVGAVTVLAVVGAAAAMVFFATQTPAVPEKTVLTLDLDRGLAEDGPGGLASLPLLGGSRPTLWETVAAVERAAEDDRVVGLVARVGASGMGMARVQELRDAVRAFRQSGKPAYAFAESFGDFGPGNSAYYLAAAFEKIYLQPSGDVGLTGLLAQGYFLKGTLEKLDVRFRVGQREEYKGIRERFTESGFTPAQREAITRILASLTQQLTDGIAGDRNIAPEAVHALMQRAPLSAGEALEAGLVDALRYRDEVNELIRGKLGDDAAFLPVHRYSRRLEARDGEAATVALIYGLGQIHRGRSRQRVLYGADSIGSDSIARALRRAAGDDKVRAILFRIDSAGGSYVASDVIRREVIRARRRGKPVIVSMGEVAGSGGYFIAAPADRIVAQPATLTGSIGVAAGKVVTTDFWEPLGVSWDAIPGNSNATFWSMVHDYDPPQSQRLESLLDAVYQDFVAGVAEGRKLSREQVLAVAKGRVWTGADARERGLVDDLGGYAAALRAVREVAGIPSDTAIRLRLFPRRKSTLRLVSDALTGDPGEAPALTAPDFLNAMAERFGPLADWARVAGLPGRGGLLEMALPARIR